MKIVYSDNAVKQLRTIARGNKKVAGLIFQKIEGYAANPELTTNLKPLKGRLGTFTRLRVGSFRVIFEVIDNTLHVYEVKDRKDAY